MLLGNTGWTGTIYNFTGNTAIYFINGNYNLLVPISNTQQKNYIYASCQVFTGHGGILSKIFDETATSNTIGNISATIMRNTNTPLGSTALPQYTYNLSYSGNTGDVNYPNFNSGAHYTTAISSALWSYGPNTTGSTNFALHCTTINMQAIDANNYYINNDGNSGATCAYYAIRIATDTKPLYFGNVNINCIQLN